MSKYDPLRVWLEKQPGTRLRVFFEDIEDLDKIGVQLPTAAKEDRNWWANEANPQTRHYQCRAWTRAGWKVEAVELRTETVVFARVSK